MKICIDPGHGMSNRTSGVYDPGTTFSTYSEASIALDWANELRDILKAAGHEVVRTRIDAKDPAPVSRRDDIARSYGCQRMISIHCNAATGQAHGTETFYRGADDKAMAERLNAAVVTALGTRNRGAKTEQESQHPSLAVMEFDKCWLVELGFLDNAGNRAAILDPVKRRAACIALAEAITSP